MPFLFCFCFVFCNYKNINREGKENAQTDDWNRCARNLPVIVNDNSLLHATPFILFCSFFWITKIKIAVQFSR